MRRGEADDDPWPAGTVGGEGGGTVQSVPELRHPDPLVPGEPISAPGAAAAPVGFLSPRFSLRVRPSSRCTTTFRNPPPGADLDSRPGRSVAYEAGRIPPGFARPVIAWSAALAVARRGRREGGMPGRASGRRPMDSLILSVHGQPGRQEPAETADHAAGRLGGELSEAGVVVRDDGRLRCCATAASTKTPTHHTSSLRLPRPAHPRGPGSRSGRCLPAAAW